MESFKTTYTEKCRDFLCEPIKPLVDALDAAISRGVVLSTIKLNGNSKDLFNKRVEYMQVFALSEALHDNNTVTDLDLSFNNIDDAGVATIARLMKFNKSIRRISLQGNSIGSDGATKLAESLSEAGGGGGGVEVLNLNFNPIGEGGGQEIAKMLRHNNTLKILDLGNTELGMKSLVSLASSLNEANRTLVYLDVENPRLYSVQEEGTLHFSRCLAVNNVLKAVKLGKHDMRDHGCLTLVSYGMVNNCTLTTLDLRCNVLSEESGPHLARLIVENSTLTTLALPSNNIKDNGCVHVAQALPYNQTLTSLDMSYNHIEEKGLLALAEGMRENTSLSELKIWGNYFGPLCSEALLLLLEEKGRQSVLYTDFRPYQVDDKIYVAKIDAPEQPLDPATQFLAQQDI